MSALEPDWTLARCVEHDPGVFFPTADDGHDWRTPKTICAGCPIRSECLEFALVSNQQFGVWGGVGERERRRLRVGRGSVPGRHFTDLGVTA